MAKRGRAYFAQLDAGEFQLALPNKLKDAERHPLYVQSMERARIAYMHTFGDDTGFGDTQRVQRGGNQGELAKVRVNNAPALARAQHALTTSAKVSWRALATNSDARTQAATTIATSLLEYYWRQRNMQAVTSRWVMGAIRYGESYVYAPWDWSRGPEVGVSADGLRIERAGDIALHNVCPWDIRRDGSATSWESVKWVAVRLRLNKWDVAALATTDGEDAPKDITGRDATQAILGASEGNDSFGSYSWRGYEDDGEDLVPVWYFFHDRTPAVPGGREAIMCGNRVLVDGPLAHPMIPVARMAPDERDGTSFGNTPYHDILGIQEMRDGLHSAVATNQLALAVQAIAMQDGTKASIDDTHGVRVFYYPPGGGKPEAIQLTRSPPEVFQHMAALKAEQVAIMGLNDVALGQPQEKLSGSAYALLYSAAAQQNSGLQGSMVAAVGQLGTVVLKTLRKFVSEERAVVIAGKSAAGQARQVRFRGADLEGIDEVTVEIGNPLEQSVPGKLELLNTYRQAGAITSADHVQQVVETGRIEPATQSTRNEMQLIAAEQEALGRGEGALVHTYQNHIKHCVEHKCVLDSDEALKRPDVVQVVQQHIDEHYREHYGLPDEVPVQDDPLYLPRLRALLGYAPTTPDLLQAPGAPPAPPGGEGGEGVEPTEAMTTPPPGMSNPLGPNGPQMPTNPVTGQQVNPAEQPAAMG